MPVRTRRSKRQVTSAISDLTVSEVRKGLDVIRKLYHHHPDTFFLTTIAYGHRSIHQFCYEFVLGNHIKRHIKSSTKKT